VTISGSALVECVTIPYWIINLFLLSICCVGRAVDSTRQLSLRFQLWFQVLHRLCFRWRFLVRSDAVSLAIPCVNADSVSLLISCVNHELVFIVDSITQLWLNFRRWFLVTVTQFSMMISWWPFAECVSQFHVLVMNPFLLSICCVGRALDSTRQLSLRFQLWFQCLHRLCFRWRFRVRRDAVSLVIPSINDDFIFSIDFMRQSWISVRCRFHQSAATQFSKMISRSTGT